MKKFLASLTIFLFLITGSVIAGEKGKCIEGNCKNGTGTKEWPDGKKYVGEWKNGKRHGKGTMTHPDGKEQKGKWKNGKYVGK